MMNSPIQSKFEYAVATCAIPGEEISGDQYLVQFYPDGALFAVIDGAGHGQEAASAASAAISVLKMAPDLSPAALLNLCHEKLRPTRGAAISLLSIHFPSFLINWAGVGNVEVVLMQKGEDGRYKKDTLLLRNGVVGYQFSQPRISVLQLYSGNILIFSTDGMRSNFYEGISLEHSCQRIADTIMEKHAKGTDDALVLVIRVSDEILERAVEELA